MFFMPFPSPSGWATPSGLGISASSLGLSPNLSLPDLNNYLSHLKDTPYRSFGGMRPWVTFDINRTPLPNNWNSFRNKPKPKPSTPKKVETTKEVVDVPPMPEWDPLYLDIGFSGSYDDKYSFPYSRFFVGVVKPPEGQQKEDKNKPWWDWSFKNRYEKRKGTEDFDSTKVTNGDSLRTACQKAYKGTLSSGNSYVESEGEKYPETEIWLFCSPAETKIESVSSQGEKEKYDDSTYGGKYKEELVSVESTSEGNKWFWKYEHSKLGEDDKPNFFDDQVKTIKDWCKKAYQMNVDLTSSDSSKPYTIFKHCSVSGTPPKGKR